MIKFVFFNLSKLVCLYAEDAVTSSPDVGDLSPEGPLPPLILLQQLLSAGTQPSPIKAIFDRQEMEVRQSSSLQLAGVCSNVADVLGVTSSYLYL